jgi:Cu/Ag efflux pump CusA
MKRKRITLLLAIGLPAVVILLGSCGVGVFLVRNWFLGRGQRPSVVVEVLAAYPGASAEEVERQVAIPLEVTLAGMPGLKSTRSQSLFGLARVQVEFEPRVDYEQARHQVIDRLAAIAQPLPPDVTPVLSPAGSAPVILRYTLSNPKDPRGDGVYTLADLTAVQDWTLERRFRRVPRIVDVDSFGGRVKRYEIQPDPDRLRRYGITLQQLATALTKTNANVGGDYVNQGQVALTVRGIGQFGGGLDPLQAKEVTAAKDPQAAAAYLRAEEGRRLKEIRQMVIATVNNVPVRVEDVVEGGRLLPGEVGEQRGVVIGSEPRSGIVGLSRIRQDAHGNTLYDADGQPLWLDEDARGEGLILLRPGEEVKPALEDIKAAIAELNNSGELPPGVRIEPFYEQAVAVGSSRVDRPDDPVWVHGSFSIGSEVEAMTVGAQRARGILRQFPEVVTIVSEIGRPEDGTGFTGPCEVQLLVQLKPANEWAEAPDRHRPRTRSELLDEFGAGLDRAVPGVSWSCTRKPFDGFREMFQVASDFELVKIIGPDLDELERLASQTRKELEAIPGIVHVGGSPVHGQPHLEFRLDPEKCSRLGVSVADAGEVLRMAVGSKTVTRLVEGERTYELVLRWSASRRMSATAILDLPVDVAPAAGPAVVLTPRLRLQDLVTPGDAHGQPDPQGAFVRQGVGAIYREQGKRLISVRFQVTGDRANVLRAAQDRVNPLVTAPYRTEWSLGAE